MDNYHEDKKNSLESITGNQIDIVFLEAIESLHDLKKRRQRIELLDNEITRKNNSKIFNDYIEITYTSFEQIRNIMQSTFEDVMNQNKKIILFNCDASPIIEVNDQEYSNGLYVTNFNSIAELINKLQTLDVLIQDMEEEVGLVIVDKINFYYNKNVYINITEDYFKEEKRIMPKVMMKSKISSNNSRNNRRSTTTKKTEFEYMETAIMNLFRHHIKYNFNLIVTQFDFSREKFLSSLKFSQKGAIKETFNNFTFIFQNNIYNLFSVQFIFPNEEELNEEIKATCGIRRDNEKIKLIYFDLNNSFEVKTIPFIDYNYM